MDPAVAEQHDGLALDQPAQVLPVHPRQPPHLGVLGVAVAASVGRGVGGLLRDFTLAGGALNVLPGFAALLQLHQDLQVGVAE